MAKPKAMDRNVRAKAERKLAGWGEVPGQQSLPIPKQTTKDSRK